MKKVITFMLSILIVVSLNTLATTAYANTYSKSIKINIIEGTVKRSITSIETSNDHNNKDYSFVTIDYVIQNTSFSEDNTVIKVTSDSDNMSLYQVTKTEPIAQSTGSIKLKTKDKALTVTFVDNHDTNIIPQSITF